MPESTTATRQGLDKDSAYLAIEDQVLPRLLPDALYEAKMWRNTSLSNTAAAPRDLDGAEASAPKIARAGALIFGRNKQLRGF